MSKPNANPFFEADFSKMMDVTKMMGEFKVPGFNFEALMNLQRKNIEAFTALNQAAYESMQSLFRRQAELARQSFEETSSTLSTVMNAGTPEEKVMRHAEVSKAAVEKCIANARDITDTLTKCNQQAMETVSNRLSESMDEIRDIVRPGSNRAA